MKIQFEYELDGRRLQIEGAITPTDHDVGIMGPGLEDIVAIDEFGNEVELTDEQEEAMCLDSKVMDAVDSAYYRDDGFDD